MVETEFCLALAEFDLVQTRLEHNTQVDIRRSCIRIVDCPEPSDGCGADSSRVVDTLKATMTIPSALILGSFAPSHRTS